MTRNVKIALGIAAAVGGYLLLKNGALAAIGGTSDAPGVLAGDVKYSVYQAAWDTAKAQNQPYFTLVGSVKRQFNGRAVTWGYTWETPGGSLIKQYQVG
jgi:hypothetical protein